MSAIFGTPSRGATRDAGQGFCSVTRYNAVSCGIEDLYNAIPIALDEETIHIHADTAHADKEKMSSDAYTHSIFYKRQHENVTRVSLKFFKNVSKSVS